MRSVVYVLCVVLLCASALAGVFTDPGYEALEDDYDQAVAAFVGQLSTLADPPPMRDENYVRMLLTADQTFKQLENSPRRLRYTVAFPIYKDGLHDMFVSTADEFVDPKTAQHVHDDLQARAVLAREAIALRK